MTSYDQTRDPRTGRPVLPKDAEKVRQKQLEGEEQKGSSVSVEFSGNPMHDPSVNEVESPRDVSVLPPSTTLRPTSEESAAVGEAFLDLEAPSPRRQQPTDEASKPAEDIGQRPEALAEFAQSAREGNDEKASKTLSADEHTAPIPTSNRDKHEVAERLLHEGVEGEHPDPKKKGVDKLPDRIIESR